MGKKNGVTVGMEMWRRKKNGNRTETQGWGRQGDKKEVRATEQEKKN